MKIVYNNGKIWSGSLEDAIHAFSAPLKIGDCIQCKGNLYKIEAINGAWAWAWWGGTPLGSLYIPTLEYAIPGSVDGVGVKDILGHLEDLHKERILDAALAAQRAENARALKAAEDLKRRTAALKAEQEAKQEAQRAENVRTFKAAEHLKNSSAKFKVGDIVKSIGNDEATYKITSVWPTWAGWFYNMEVETMSGVRLVHERRSYVEMAESLLSAGPKFAVGDRVKYLRGTDHYLVRAYKNGQYTLYNLNNGSTYYESKDSRLVAI